MKATGIIRRIDDLGRVVIPKEIRRTLRIREGDPLELFISESGNEVVLKKYSAVANIEDFASQYAESLYKTSGHTICITDRDMVVAVSGPNKKEFLGKPLSSEMERVIEGKTVFLAKSVEEQPIPIVSGEDHDKEYTSQVVTPIISDGEPIGAIIMFSTDSNVKMGEVEMKLAQAAAGFIGKQMDM